MSAAFSCASLPSSISASPSCAAWVRNVVVAVLALPAPLCAGDGVDCPADGFVCAPDGFGCAPDGFDCANDGFDAPRIANRPIATLHCLQLVRSMKPPLYE